MSDRLPVRDEFFLLAHDDSGKPLVHVAMLGLGMAAAVLIDLALDGDIDTSSGRVLTRPRPGSAQAGPVGLDIAGRALSELAAEQTKPPETIDVLLTWQSSMYERVRGELVAAEILQTVKVRRLGLVSTTRYQVVDEAIPVRARTALRRTISGQHAPTAGDGALCGLVRELQLERTLHLSQDSGVIRKALKDIADRHHQTVKQIFSALGEAIRYKSTATH